MTNPADAPTTQAADPRRARGARWSAAAVAFAFWTTMAGTTAPTPLYPIYGQAFGFSPFTVTVVFAVYAIGVVVGLLLLGRLSDQIGRRPVLIGATLTAMCAATVLLLTQNLAVMLVGRVLSGFAAALVTGAATAALTELIPPGGRIRPAAAALTANMGGLAGGTLLAGILADLAPAPLRTPWVVLLILSALSLIAVAATSESSAERPGFVFRVQALRIPAEIRPAFLRAAMATGAGFAVLGVLTAVTGLFLSGELHLHSHSLTGLVVATAFACTALGQPLSRAIPPGRALPTACLGLVVGAALIATAMATTTLAPLILGAAVNGLASGIAMADGLTTITTGAAPQQRGEAVSTFFAILYTMLALPAIGVGVLIRATSLRPAGEVFSAVVAALALAVLLSLTHTRRSSH
ncbi:MFS family permease [Kitasatospora sp. MAP12-15]|uniref:MFS transporter n=1 Tax=unclassified Kitasatospora TaxID=2633591 RepID=UPI0024759F98|nr:MFS transporter [Kitasatospora sp. MAP12-44]MDH6115098.1 MFS family permease [Kitasatospora sp. MAP12-44]